MGLGRASVAAASHVSEDAMSQKMPRWKIHLTMQARSACVSFFVLVGLIGLRFGVCASETKLGPDILAAFQDRGAVCVCVEFQDAPLIGAVESSAPGTESLASRRKRYALAQTAFLATLPQDSYELRYRYRYSPAVVLVAKAPEVLATIENNSAVRRVYPELRGTGSLFVNE